MSIICMCVCGTFSHSIFSALAERILSGSGLYWILLKIINYTFSNVKKTVLVKIRKLRNTVAFATNPVKYHIVRKVFNR